ncbi:MAG: RNA polymerase sigma-70 factor (family 1) [Patescibacteria group bacterium]|jgi:RNA polymerase sigma-70 factor (family 1)
MSPKLGSLCEEKVYTTIFKEYSKTLHNYIFYKTGDPGIAKDLAQEAFTRLWLNCASVIPETAKSYVFKIANNLLINEHKHRQVVLRFEKRPASEADQESPEFLMEQKELQAELEAAIAALPEKQRVVFLMSRMDKKTYKEIAAILEISKQAVEKRMYNALDVLRRVSAGIR